MSTKFIPLAIAASASLVIVAGANSSSAQPAEEAWAAPGTTGPDIDGQLFHALARMMKPGFTAIFQA